MEHDPLEQLLRDADGSAERVEPRSPGELARRVFAADRRRRLRTQTGIGVVTAALFVATGLWFSVPRETSAPSRMTEAEVAAMEAELAALDREAAMREAIVERLRLVQTHQEQRRQLGVESSNIDLAAEHGIEVESVATLMVIAADRRLEADGASAYERYRRVIELYPETRAAETAKQRLASRPSGSNTRHPSRERQSDV